MGIVLDIIVLVILGLSIFFGYKRGLIGVAFNLCAFFAAIIITWILYTPITNLVINNTQIDEGIKSAIIEKGLIKTENEDSKKSDNKEENPVNEYIQKYVTTPATDTANEAITNVAGVVSEKVVAIGVAIVLFIVVRIALILLKFLANMIAEIPIIKQCNEVGGIIYGVVTGLFIIYVLLAVLFFVMSVNNSGTVAEMINTSIISKFLYTHNLILNILF